MALFKGLTWDHPRGYNALAAAAHQNDLIAWDRQPLEGFESAPIGQLCKDYDLVVMDHPHLGEAMGRDCLLPLETVFPQRELKTIARDTIGASYQSYKMDGCVYALPLDAASQVMAYRRDKVGDELPVLWSDVVARAQAKADVALCLAGPHALLSLLSIACAMDEDLDLRDGFAWLDDDLCREAYALLKHLHAFAIPGLETFNPITLLEAMSERDDIALCPLVYGYVNYTMPPSQTQLRFANAPRVRIDGRPGSILGGTGIAISRRAKVTDQLVNHLLWLLSVDAQHVFIPHHQGQPSARSACGDKAVNAASAAFYTSTAATLDAAVIRPRFDGFIAFQAEASSSLRSALETGQSAASTAKALRELFTTLSVLVGESA